MKVTAETLPESQVLLQIELEEPEIERHKDRAYRRLVQRWAVPGFRKGKTPRAILERYLGPDALVQEDLENLLEQTALEAVKQQSLDAVARPEITEVQSLAPISFKVTVPVRPKIDLGDYASLRVTWEPPAVKPEDEQEVLEAVRRQTTPWEPVERPVQLGDLAALDIRGEVTESISPEGNLSTDNPGDRVFIDQKGLSYPVQEDSTYPMPGFPAQVVGMQRDETREFTLTAKEDFNVRDLAGKECRFQVTLHEVKEQRLPEIDDEWAKGVMGGFESLEALRSKVRVDLQERAEAQAHAEYEDKVLTALEAQVKGEFPPVLVDSEIDHMLQDQDERLRPLGFSLAQHMTSSGRTLQEIQDEVRPQARQRVLRSLIVSQLADAEKVIVPPEEVDAEVQRIVSAQPEGDARTSAEQLFGNDAAQDTVRRRILARKTVDRLIAIARGEGGAASAPEKGHEEAPTPTEAH